MKRRSSDKPNPSMDQADKPSAPTGQSVAKSTVGGHVVQVAGVGGNVQISLGSGPDLGKDLPRARAANPYLLLETGEVIGRAELRAEISHFLSAPKSASCILLLIGIPGVGKSALAWDAWKLARSNCNNSGRRQFWYSFYDGRGSGTFGGMLTELGRFLGIDGPDHDRLVTADEVIEVLTEHEIVLFLDGIERCLRCYQRPLAIGDLEAIRVQENKGFDWTESDLGFATDDMSRFFLQLAELDQCRVLATSRVVPSDYFASGGGLRAGVTSRSVGALGALEAGDLLSAVGMRIAAVDATVVAGVFGGHPLALQLFAREASRAVDARRDLLGWMNDNGYSAIAGRGPAEIRERLFSAVTAHLSPGARMGLVTIGVMGGALDLADLRDMLLAQPIGESEERFQTAIEEITASGMGHQTPDGQLACHTMVALVAADQLAAQEVERLVRVIEASLRGRFESIDTWLDGYYQWFVGGAVSDRAEAMALCRALVNLGEFTEAGKLYAEQLHNPICWVLGANFEALELLQALIAGLESQGGTRDSHPDQFRSFLAHHLLMTGRIRDAEATLAAMRIGRQWHHTKYTSSEVLLHSGDTVPALEVACDMLHQARTDLAIATGEDYDFMGLMSGGIQGRLNGPLTDLFESIVLCVRLLLLGGYRGEAALLLTEGIQLRNSEHEQCDGCYGLLIRCAAEILLSTDNLPLAIEVAALGKKLQESQGKALQGLLSEVLVASAQAAHAEAPSEPQQALLTFLGDTGFVLYQLILQAAADITAAKSSGSANSRSIHALGEAGAQFALEFLRDSKDQQVHSLPETLVNRCIGWLLEERSVLAYREREQVSTGRRNADDDATPAGDQDRITGFLMNALEAEVHNAFPVKAMAETGRQVAERDSIQGLSSGSRAIWDKLPAACRARAKDAIQKGDTDGHHAALDAALELDPCDVQSLSGLAWAAARRGDDEEAAQYVRKFCTSYSCSSSYNYAVSLVTSNGTLATRVRETLSRLARADHATHAAYRALAKLERRIGDEQAAQRWDEAFRAVTPQGRFFGYPNDLTE